MTHDNTMPVVCACFHVRMMEKIFDQEPDAFNSKKSRLQFLRDAIEVAK